MNYFGEGIPARESWFMKLTYWALSDQERADDARAGAPWRRFLQSCEPVFDALFDRCEHPEVLFDVDWIRPEWLLLLAKSFGLQVDQYYPVDWRKTSVRTASQWWARKGRLAALEYLARVYGFRATVQEVWEKGGCLTFDSPPAMARMDEFPMDMVPLDMTAPRGTREISVGWLNPSAGVPLVNAVTWVNGSDLVTSAGGFLAALGSVGVDLEDRAVFLFNSTDEEWVQVKEVLANTVVRLVDPWMGTDGACITRVWPVTSELSGNTTWVGPGEGRHVFDGDLSFYQESQRVLGDATKFIDEIGGLLVDEEDVYVWSEVQRLWAKVLRVEDQSSLTLGAEYPGAPTSGPGAWTVTPNGDRVVTGAGSAFVAEVGALGVKTWAELEDDGVWYPVDEVVSNSELRFRETYSHDGGTGKARICKGARVQLYDLMEGETYTKTDLVYVDLTYDLSEALTGALTLVDGVTAVEGVGTVFATELLPELGEAYIKVDGETKWHRVKQVIDDTHLELFEAPKAGEGAAGAARWSPRTVLITGIDVIKALQRLVDKFQIYVRPVHVRLILDFNIEVLVPPIVIGAVVTQDIMDEVLAMVGKRFDDFPMDDHPLDDKWLVETDLEVVGP